MRLFGFGLILLLALLVYDFYYGKNGYLDYQTVTADIDIQTQVNSSLKKRNDQMQAEIDDLKQGLDAIEERARHELGLVKEGETFYRLIEDKNEAKPLDGQ